MSGSSSSQPPTSQLSQILERLKRPAWRMPQEMRHAVVQREASNNKMLEEINFRKGLENLEQEKINEKKEWIKKQPKK